VLIDRVDFGANALRHDLPDSFPVFYQNGADRAPVPVSATGRRTRIAQQATAHVTTLEDVLAHPNAVPTLAAVQADLVFDLAFHVRPDGDVWYRAALDHIEPGPLPMPVPFPLAVGDLVKAVNSQLGTLVPSRSGPLGLVSILPKGVLFTNAGISVDTQMQRVALRVEIGGRSMNADVPWSNFLNGFFDDLLA
jgi:hypothetical protein